MFEMSQDPIKRSADGSIDTAHYMQIGRQVRSDEVYKMTKVLLALLVRRPRLPVWFMRPFSARVR